MSKRENDASTVVADVESRTKRRKEATDDVSMQDPITNVNDEAGPSNIANKEQVKELGMTLWQTVKDAVDKDGRTLSTDFLRRPSKRQWPDYYQIIAQPIALDDIKKKIENSEYHTLESVRHDFELCFKNAKQYNLKESGIWNDAKDLLKLANKTYAKLAKVNDEEGGEDEDNKSKSKPPNMNRLLKSRLQKLVDKTDETGRLLSTEFMELPSKKLWPVYYKAIKRPMCIETIFKHLKRKEYHTSADFASDVELVFSNAMTFNEEYTPIWEDARTLRDYFRQLMSDLPAPYSLPEYNKTSSTKIKLKMPSHAQTNIAPSTNKQVSPTPASTSLTLRVPGTATGDKAHSQPITVSVSSQPATSHQASSTLPPVAQATAPPAAPPANIKSSVNSTTSAPSHYYLNVSHRPSVGTNLASAPKSSTPLPVSNSQTQATNSASNSPPPTSAQPKHQIKSVLLKTEPNGRFIPLDYREGVKIWAMRLGAGEKGLCIRNVTLLGDEEEESSDDDDQAAKEQDSEDGDTGVSPSSRNGRKKGKGRGRGRPPKAATNKFVTKPKVSKKQAPKPDDMQVKLNGSTIKEADRVGEWHVDIPAGCNVVEVGEKGGFIWKVYVERISDS